MHQWSGPRWPLIGRAAAELVIGPVFIHGIASRTLAGIKRHVEAGAGAAGSGAVSQHEVTSSMTSAHVALPRACCPAARRVVITGIGAVTPIGLGAEGLWDGLRRRVSAIRTITRFDPSVFKSRIAGEVDGFHPTDHIEERRARRLDRYSQFTIAATRMALADASLDLRLENQDRVGAMMGTALGGVAHGEQQYHNFLTKGPRSVDPALALTVFAGAASCNIAIEFGCTGPNATNGMSCASGAIAIGEAFRAIAQRPGGRDAGRRGRGSARPALLRRLRHHPRHVHPQ